ncbi:MAG: Asp-tRNA(Asn)/Glu-tRNA(Gln) amidotransferase subunit GatA [Clostridiales bacterium]|nr:Asp-tRNA(Asn)/Glu-tRNA(Gln) amidotransferase subunit GatA [Clostridiales bacterium]
MSIMDMPLTELTWRLASREITSVEVTRAFMAQEDSIGAFITRCDDALLQAERADRLRAEGDAHPLCGVPVAVKDNICTAGVRTSCASRMLENFVPPYNATAWQRMQQAGCVLLGKTNMDEFGMGSSTENSAFCVTRNPHNTGHVPGGSSGGSAAAVAAGLAPAALGSDTGGSVRQPAAFCGVVGMKPTYGTVSRYGLVAFASSLDTIGPVTSTVADNAMILDVLAGADPLDATSARREHLPMAGQISQGVKGLVIGIPAELLAEGVSADVRHAVESAAHALEAQGARVEEISLPHAQQALPAYYVLSSAEASSNLARYDGVRYGRRAKEYDDLDDLYVRSRSEGFGEEVKRRILLGTYALSAGYYDAYYKTAQQVRQLVKQDFHVAFTRCDALLSPVAATGAWRFGEKTDPTEMYMSDLHTVPASLAGIPALSVPFGKDSRGLPLGVQLMGRPFEERLLYRIGHVLEVIQHG